MRILVLFVFEAFLLALALLLLNQGKGAVHLEGSRWLALLGVMFLNTLGFAAVGTLFALMAQRTRRGDVLLPVMQAVLSMPVLIPAVVATQRVLHPAVPLGDIKELVTLAAVFAIVVVAVALIVFEYVVEE